MARLLPLLLLLALTGYDVAGQTTPADQSDRVASLERMTSQLARQLMLQQLYTEETARSGGDSGLKQIRLRNDGSKTYYTENFAYRSMASLHDHSNHVRTCGMGEFIAVLNGVEFRTRHNDYKLVMPSTTSGEYHATEDIEYPAVPPEVLQKTTVEEQIVELREWFKAWQDGNHTVRDYRQYFKPLLCYLEGGWTTSGSLEEPFDSDTHHLDADSWFDLQEKIRFTSYTGDKNLDENFAYLPTTIMNVTDGVPVFGQWNYRILCHPIQGGVELSELKPIDNLANRLSLGKTFDAYVNSRSARFSLDPSTSDEHFTWSRLDQVMYQIPGQDNYKASLDGSTFGNSKVRPDTEAPLNAGFYHRWFKVLKKDAMGERVLHRGFADRNLFVAETTQPTVASMSIPYCRTRKDKRLGTCDTLVKKVSYAVPLEVVFLTPLQAWNPYDLQYKGEQKSPLGETVSDGGKRNGQLTPKKAFNGTNSREFYRTPAEFFEGKEVDRGSADTTRNSVGVLDKDGNMRAVAASGVRIFLPNIPGVGVARTRYPIMPMFVEGAAVWKEMEALRDVVMNMQAYMDIFLSPPTVAEAPMAAPQAAQAPQSQAVSAAAGEEQAPMDGGQKISGEGQAVHLVLETSPTNDGHVHTIGVSRFDYFKLTRRDKIVSFKTSAAHGHSHFMMVDYDEGSKKYLVLRCDNKPECSDGHARELIVKVAAP